MTNHEQNDKVLVGMKTPLLAHGLTALLPGHLTLAESLSQIRGTPPKDATAQEVVDQLEVETSGGEYHFLTVTGNGQLVRSAPTTRLKEVAVPREIKTSRGVEVIPAAAVEIQSYARVGGAGSCS